MLQNIVTLFRRVYSKTNISIINGVNGVNGVNVMKENTRQHHFMPVTYSISKNSERALLLILNAFAFYYNQIEFEC
jgi:hypothetical protein